MSDRDPKSPSPDYELNANRAPPEIVVVPGRKVSCNGGGGALGHPIVWYEMGDDDFVECKYCDRRFVLEDKSAF